MAETDLHSVLEQLIQLPKEIEWVECKHNFHSPDEIGQQLSALSNSACLHNQNSGFLIYGIEDETFQILGTDFKPSTQKKGNEEIEHWIAQRLNPKADFRIFEFEYDNKPVVIFQIDAAIIQPVDFLHEAYIRVDSITRKAKRLPAGLIKEDDPDNKSRKYTRYIPNWA